MSKLTPKTPIEGNLRSSLTRFTRNFADVLEDCCEDWIMRVMVYSDKDGSIWMKAIVSDEDGAQLLILFQMEPDGTGLKISKKFATVGGPQKRTGVFATIQNALVEYISNLNTLSERISSIVFDLGQRFVNCYYEPNPKEPGCIRIYMLSYRRDYGMAEMSGVAGAEMVNV